MFDEQENPSDFLLNLMRSHQDLPFPTRIKHGILLDNQRSEKETCQTCRKKPERILLTSMKSYQDFIFVYHGKGWEHKGKQKWWKRQACDR